MIFARTNTVSFAIEIAIAFKRAAIDRIPRVNYRLSHAAPTILARPLMRRAIVLAGLLSATMSGCTNFADAPEAPVAVAALPAAFPKVEIAGAYRPAQWWTGFEDPVLDAVVSRALARNLDIAEAAARLARANAQARIARSAQLPSLDATVGTSFSDSPLAGSGFGSFGQAAPAGDVDAPTLPPDAQVAAPTRLQVENYGIGVAASYEVDIFGRVLNDALAARSDAQAAAFDVQTVQLAAAAEAISTYFDIVDARRQIELTLASVDILTDRVARAEDRFARGLGESFELYRVRQDLRVAQASLPVRESALRNATSRLALVLRDVPQAVDSRLDTALRPRLVFDPVPSGLPVELLSQRPDVAAAYTRFESARLRIGARRAERYPAIRLTGSLGTQAGDPLGAFDIIDNWALSLASNLTAPLFNAGRIGANIDAARATYDEAAAGYTRAVLRAYGEVAAANAEYEEQRQRYRLVLDQLTEAEASAELQAARFRSGVGAYTAYLDAVRAVRQVESSLSGAGRDVALARLGVHRALGGDWAGEIVALEPVLEPPTDKTAEPPPETANE